MAEKDKITESKVKYSGIFDFKEVYQFVYRWLDEEDYWIEEKKYIEEVSGDTKKVEIQWIASKKISDYFKFEHKLNWRIIGLTSIEVEKNGKKIKMNKGNFEIKIASTLVKDWEGTWEKQPYMKFLRGLYDRFLIEGRIKSYEIKCFLDGQDLAEQIKAFFAIEGMK
ncbi:MAG: hypothetical protein WC781_01315 [Candidatus Pacearchaeota archaeon]|jgi:hypothetical protein